MDTTLKKIQSDRAPQGPMGERYLVSGKTLSMRLWNEEPGQQPETVREYETVGFVVRGKARLVSEGQSVLLEAGDSWLVPPAAAHSYQILEPFVALEATAPPAHVGGRDAPPPQAREAGGEEA